MDLTVYFSYKHDRIVSRALTIFNLTMSMSESFNAFRIPTMHLQRKASELTKKPTICIYSFTALNQKRSVLRMLPDNPFCTLCFLFGLVNGQKCTNMSKMCNQPKLKMVAVTTGGKIKILDMLTLIAFKCIKQTIFSYFCQFQNVNQQFFFFLPYSSIFRPPKSDKKFSLFTGHI